MTFYNKPWDAGYSLPAYERQEDPLTRGSARTTPWSPRGTISRVPAGSNHGGYAVPTYVLKEPVGSQAQTTPWLPRRTVPSMKGIKTGLPWKSSAHTLDSNGLGSLGDNSEGSDTSSVGGNDPIVAYGKKAAAVIVADFKAIPAARREAELLKLLNEVDTRLYASYRKEAKQLETMGVSKEEAQQKGLAIAFSQGLTGEFIRLGKSGKSAPPGLRKGQVPLAALMGFDAQVSNYHSVGGVLSTVKSTLSKIGGLACDVATNPITPLAAGAAGAGAGGPVGASTAMAGAGIAAAACAKDSGGGGMMFPQSSGTPAWVLPAIIGGGALALVFILKK